MKHLQIFIKRHIVPQKYNDYQPTILRTHWFLLTVLIAASLALLIKLGGQGGLPSISSVNEERLIGLTNQARQRRGLKELSVNSRLQAAAEARVEDMLEHQYFGHYNPDGTPPWQALIKAKYAYAAASENLARDFKSNQGVIDGWLASPAHRQALLNPDYTQIGLAAVEGELSGRSTELIVAIYAAPQSGAGIIVGSAAGENFELADKTVKFSVSRPLSAFSTLPFWAVAIVLGMLTLAGLYVWQHLVGHRSRQLFQHSLLRAWLLLGLIVLICYLSLGVVQ